MGKPNRLETKRINQKSNKFIEIDLPSYSLFAFVDLLLPLLFLVAEIENYTENEDKKK